MLAHCANCYALLHSFCEGRLFQFEVVSISVAAGDDTTAPFDEKPERQTAHFWLCGRCAGSMTVMLEPALGVRVVPVAWSGPEGTGVEDAATRGREARDR